MDYKLKIENSFNICMFVWPGVSSDSWSILGEITVHAGTFGAGQTNTRRCTVYTNLGPDKVLVFVGQTSVPAVSRSHLHSDGPHQVLHVLLHLDNTAKSILSFYQLRLPCHEADVSNVEVEPALLPLRDGEEGVKYLDHVQLYMLTK